MYADVDSIEEWAAAKTDDPRPLILCEYSHAMGNSNGGLADYFAAFRQHEALQGGFIWEWVDHGIRQRGPRADASTGRTAATSATSPNDANFCADGIVWPDRTPHPALHELKFLAQPIHVESRGGGRFRIHNRHYFSPLDGYRGEWELTVDGKRRKGGRLPRAGASAQARRSTSRSSCRRGGGERFVTFRFFLRSAQRLGTGRTRGRAAAARRAGTGGEASSGRAVRPSPDGVLETDSVRAVVDLAAGVLRELALDGRNVLVDGPRLQLWRAPTDNDGLPQVPSRQSGVLPRWLELGLDRLQPAIVSARAVGSAVELVHRADGLVTHRQRYRLLATGELQVENVVELSPQLRDVPRIGAGLIPPTRPRSSLLVRPRARGRRTRTGSRPRSSAASRARSPTSTCPTSSRRSTATIRTLGG